MVLSMVGLGLGDEKDITLRGLEVVKAADRVYLEAYTSLLDLGPADAAARTLGSFFQKDVTLADRETVEQRAEEIVEAARSGSVAFLVVGDPFGATTHTDLVVRARKAGVEVQVIHNASVMNAIGVCGLQLYRFGETISVPFFTETWRPDSFYDKIKANKKLGLHTLCLLDIRVKEPSLEALCRGRKEYEPARYMTVNQAVEQLLEIEELRREEAYSESTLAIGLARVGTSSQKIVAATLGALLDADLGPPLHCLVVTGNVHDMEREMLSFFEI